MLGRRCGGWKASCFFCDFGKENTAKKMMLEDVGRGGVKRRQSGLLW